MAASSTRPKRPIRRLRWWICGLLFLSTVINYLDRQTFSSLAPFLQNDFKWSNEDLALIFIAFRIAYAMGQLTLGRFIDRVGTRIGLTVTVAWYSIVAMLTSLTACFRSPLGALRGFIAFRFLLGLGESPNWPAATKAVSEWFPKKERGWAVSLFDSGSSGAAAVAPMLVVGLYYGLGRHWWPAFIIVGFLGFLWLICWRMLYHSPESHPRIGEEELRMILADRTESGEGMSAAEQPKVKWVDLLKLPQTWGIISARAFTDPVWWCVTDWLMVFLVQYKHFDPKNTLVAIWIPFIATDAGNFAGGGGSSWLVQRGWRLEMARKAVVIFGAVGMMALIPAIYATNLFAIMSYIGIATFSYSCFATVALILPADLFQSNSVASVSGISGAVAGFVTVIASFLIGDITTTYSFKPVLFAGGVFGLLGAALVLWLIRNPRTENERRILRRI